ncbi:MAG: hypothetical protein FD124_3678, partial [Alphaproteobacteria bacterium]
LPLRCLRLCGNRNDDREKECGASKQHDAHHNPPPRAALRRDRRRHRMPLWQLLVIPVPLGLAQK